ncbi:Uncharacterised protein [Bordetella pertussis]|nr:Uncharacterised protein [Bordetella pertussis]
MEHLQYGDIALPAAVDQRLDLRQERRQFAIVPKRTVTEGFLDIDDDQRLFHGEAPG